MKAQISERIINFGKARFKVDIQGNWYVETFGFHIFNQNAKSPSYSWNKIDYNNVPDEVKKIIKCLKN